MDNPYVKNQNGQARQRNTVLASPSGGRKRRKAPRKHTSMTRSTLCSSLRELDEEYAFLAQRKRIKGAVTFWGTLFFGLVFLLLSSMALQFTLPMIPEIPANENILYNVGQKLYRAVFPADWPWVLGAVLSVLSLYGIPFILCAGIRLLTNSLPAPDVKLQNRRRYHDDPSQFAIDSLQDMCSQNDALSFRFFSRPVEWCIALLVTAAALLGFLWICSDAGMKISYEALPQSAVGVLLIFQLLRFPSRCLNHLLYGRGVKQRRKLYEQSIEHAREEAKENKYKEQLEKLLREAQQKNSFVITALPKVSCPQDVMFWLELANKYFYLTYPTAVRLLRNAYDQYLSEHEERKRAEEDARITANIMTRMSLDAMDKGLNTYMTDSRNGDTIYFKNGQYVNEQGERVPIQWIAE